jgi:hypothetical protein
MKNKQYATPLEKKTTLSPNLVIPAFKIAGFIIAKKYGMIRRLAAEVQLNKAAAGVCGGFGDHKFETAFVQGLAAGTAYKHAAALEQLNGPEVYFPVAPEGVGKDGTGFGKGRGVQNHKIKFFLSPFRQAEPIENVRFGGVYFLTDAVKGGVLFHYFQSGGR